MGEFTLWLAGPWYITQLTLQVIAAAGLLATALHLMFTTRRSDCIGCVGPRPAPLLLTWGTVAAFALVGLPLIHWLTPAVHAALGGHPAAEGFAFTGLGIAGALAALAAVAVALVVVATPVVLVMRGAELAHAARRRRRPSGTPSGLPPIELTALETHSGVRARQPHPEEGHRDA
jgi:hypothetical protein